MQKRSMNINEGATTEIKGIVTEMLSTEQAKALFEAEAVCFGDQDGVPQYRVVELFGQDAAYHMARMMNCKGYFEPGREYNSWYTDKKEEDIKAKYLYEAGFMKIVTNHNVLLAGAGHAASEAGTLIDELNQ